MHHPDEQVRNTSDSLSLALRRQRKIRSVFNELADWLESIMIAVLAIILIFTFVVRVTSVNGNSMFPTLEWNDRLLVTNFFYTPNYNDIVIVRAENSFNQNNEYGKPYVKRVIGLPGDTIELDTKNGHVYRNGVKLDIMYVGDDIYEDGHRINDLTYEPIDMHGPIVVGENEIFVMGDNRNASKDSRDSSVGCISFNDIIGKAFFRITPLNKMGLVN
jgi:signal peptidase I